MDTMPVRRMVCLFTPEPTLVTDAYVCKELALKLRSTAQQLGLDLRSQIASPTDQHPNHYATEAYMHNRMQHNKPKKN